jgi:hypothetical protein
MILEKLKSFSILHLFGVQKISERKKSRIEITGVLVESNIS